MKVNYTEEFIAEVASAIDIKAMKKGKYDSEGQFRKRYGQDASLYRKGGIYVQHNLKKHELICKSFKNNISTYLFKLLHKKPKLKLHNNCILVYFLLINYLIEWP